MISLVIFSYNRACQLDLLLSSIEANSNDLFSSIYVLYKANEEYSKGYDRCLAYHSDLPIYFIKEEDFRRDLFQILESPSRFTTFAVDDNILYRKLTIVEEDVDNLFGQGVDTLSLRLGRNVYIQDPSIGSRAPLPRQLQKYKNFYIWNINDVVGWSHYAYSISLDFNTYLTKKITTTLLDVDFHNPNFLEANADGKKRQYEYMACQELSSVVNSPNNKVQTVFDQNKSGEKYPLSIKELNRRFLDGYRFSIDRVDFSNICGCHVELDLQMIK